MTVRMLTSVAGVPSYQPGEIVTLEEPIARAWQAAGYCELVDVEQATVTAPVEVAVQTRKKRR